MSLLLVDVKTKDKTWVDCDLSIYRTVSKVHQWLQDEQKIKADIQPVYFYAGKWLRSTTEVDCLMKALVVYLLPLKPWTSSTGSTRYSEQFDYMINVLGFDNVPQVMICLYLTDGDLEPAINLYLNPQDHSAEI